MGSLNDFWNTSQRANDFLRTGIINDTVRNAGSINYGVTTESGNDLSSGSTCVSTSDCPSGWGCVNGVCQQLNNTGSGGSGPGQSNSPSGGGPCNPGDPGGPSPCNSGGPNSCQQTPQCGDTGGGNNQARECCGARTCSFGSASSPRPGVHCACGDSSSPPGGPGGGGGKCTSFCSSYLKANGGVGPGCTEGPSGNSCNSCSECGGGSCGEITSGADCYCSGGGCNADGCEGCDTATGSSGFGGCSVSSTCMECGSIQNYRCPCGSILPTVSACQPYGTTGPTTINQAQQKAVLLCESACSNEADETADECKPVLVNFTQNNNTPCPEGAATTGFVEAGGERISFCQTADYSSLPDSCKDCDCNCNNDCGNCQVCGPNGSCLPSPACDAECPAGHIYDPDLDSCEPDPTINEWSVWAKRTYTTSVRAWGGYAPCDYEDIDNEGWGRLEYGLTFKQAAAFSYEEVESGEGGEAYECFDCSGPQVLGYIAYNGEPWSNQVYVYVDYCFYENVQDGQPYAKLTGYGQVQMMPDGADPNG